MARCLFLKAACYPAFPFPIQLIMGAKHRKGKQIMSRPFNPLLWGHLSGITSGHLWSPWTQPSQPTYQSRNGHSELPGCENTVVVSMDPGTSRCMPGDLGKSRRWSRWKNWPWLGPKWELHDEPKKHGKEMKKANHCICGNKTKPMIPMNKHIGTNSSLQVWASFPDQTSDRTRKDIPDMLGTGWDLSTPWKNIFASQPGTVHFPTNANWITWGRWGRWGWQKISPLGP